MTESAAAAETGRQRSGRTPTARTGAATPTRPRGRPRKKPIAAEPPSPPDMQSTKVKDILSGMKRRQGGIPMPSSVARNAERRKRRRQGVDPDAVSEVASVAASAAPSGHPSESDRTDTVVAPQVRIDEDGNIVVDQDSLVVNAGVTINAERERGQVTTIENLAVGAQITSASYARRETAIKWEEAETEKFYNALRLFGTDFSLMERIFQGRTRRQLKLKFKREERNNAEKIDFAMKNRKPGGAELLAEFVEVAKQTAAVSGGETPVPEASSGDTPAGSPSKDVDVAPELEEDED